MFRSTARSLHANAVFAIGARIACWTSSWATPCTSPFKSSRLPRFTPRRPEWSSASFRLPGFDKDRFEESQAFLMNLGVGG